MTRHRVEEAHHKAFVQFLNAAMGQLPELAYFKHTKNEASGYGPKVTRIDRRSGRLREIPLDVIRGGEMGVRAGVWDFEYLGPNRIPIDGVPALAYRGLAIEFKARGNGLSEEQKRWQQHYTRNRWCTTIFYSHVDAAIFAVQWVGGDPSRFLFT